MPKRVDHQQRREQIAAALMRVAADQGLDAISLRHVAAEAGVTSGMVQHYFPTKEAMMDFAMETASSRYEMRMIGAIERLGENPPAKEVTRTILTTLLPLDESQRADGRVALAFQSYAATKPSAARRLGNGNTEMRTFIAGLIRAAQSTGEASPAVDAADAATALLAMAEGLAVYLLSSDLPTEDAVKALDAQLDLAFARKGT